MYLNSLNNKLHCILFVIGSCICVLFYDPEQKLNKERWGGGGGGCCSHTADRTEWMQKTRWDMRNTIKTGQVSWIPQLTPVSAFKTFCDFYPLVLPTPTGKPRYTCFIPNIDTDDLRELSPEGIWEITQTGESSESCQMFLPWHPLSTFACLFVFLL